MSLQASHNAGSLQSKPCLLDHVCEGCWPDLCITCASVGHAANARASICRVELPAWAAVEACTDSTSPRPAAPPLPPLSLTRPCLRTFLTLPRFLRTPRSHVSTSPRTPCRLRCNTHPALPPAFTLTCDLGTLPRSPAACTTGVVEASTSLPSPLLLVACVRVRLYTCVCLCVCALHTHRDENKAIAGCIIITAEALDFLVLLFLSSIRLYSTCHNSLCAFAAYSRPPSSPLLVGCVFFCIVSVQFCVSPRPLPLVPPSPPLPPPLPSTRSRSTNSRVRPSSSL